MKTAHRSDRCQRPGASPSQCLLALVAAWLFVGAGECYAASRQADAAAKGDDGTTDSPRGTLSQLDAARDEYLKSGAGKALQERERRDEIHLFWGDGTVMVPPESPLWAKSRAAAYEIALGEAQNGYVTFRYQKVYAETVRSLFADANADIPAFEDKDVMSNTRVGRLVDKMLAVGEGKLDKKLSELGVDPKEFKAASKPQRHQRLKDSLRRVATTSAVGSLAGLIPAMTFEGQNSRGEHAIRVLVVESQEQRQFAADVLAGRGTRLPPGPKGVPLLDLVTKGGADELMKQFGVRQVYDERGDPCLIAYGQWANGMRTASDAVNSEFQSAALDQARASADTALNSFLAGSTVFSSTKEIAQTVENYLNVHRDGFAEEFSPVAVLDTVRKETKTRGEIQPVGLRDLYTWTAKHPAYGHEIVGVVRVWTPKSEQAARKTGETVTDRSEAAPVVPKLRAESKVTRGEELMRPDQF